MRARIAGTGHYLPGPPITNEELIERHGLRVREYFIRRSIGVETRHFAGPEEATSDLAAEAARRAIEASGIPAREIRRVFLASVSGDYPTPATACVVLRKLGLRGPAAIDVVGACSGFLQALDLGSRSVATGEGPVLVIGADVRSRQMNFADPRTAFLYGDGAGAVVLTGNDGDVGFHHSILTADGSGAEAVYIPAGGSREPITAAGLEQRRNTITMPNGRLVAEEARRGFQALATRLVCETGVLLSDIDFFCLHQPNLPLVMQIMSDLAIPAERTWINFPRYGNTTSATLPIALSEAVAAGKMHDGDWVCLAAVGAGFAGAIQLIRWGDVMILITGASQGIGYECARALLERTDSTVMITGRNGDRLAAAREGLAAPLRERFLTRVCDQGSRKDVEELGAEFGSGAVGLEGAILNVGINPAFLEGPRRLHSMGAIMIEEAVRTNCTHLLLLTTAVLERLWARRSGAVVWIGSQAPSVGLPGAAVYCATKSFLSGLARAAHNEYAARGIRVHLVHPALVRTPRTAATVDRFAEAHALPVHSAADVAARVVDHYLGVADAAVEVAL